MNHANYYQNTSLAAQSSQATLGQNIPSPSAVTPDTVLSSATKQAHDFAERLQVIANRLDAMKERAFGADLAQEGGTSSAPYAGECHALAAAFDRISAAVSRLDALSTDLTRIV